ncbi:hydantoinase/oxoprolinase N-terminal domain-containing protein [Rhodobacter sp. CZR27]|uniref:hydantoinase/oxoprolinase N-terminal domain-containing protein n=1 Tax=Rhodobacter sp. CZR27 TaxID=2033869 RepID=UPI0012FE5806|nr:hydantoinase/oxoprolinase family protein [Rhodobacter sp. CZR27]
MKRLLGVDTGGTYTDAVIVDPEQDRVVGSAKSLTTRADLSLGIGRAIDAALAEARVAATDIGMVSLSTTLATNALVEGQGSRVALIFIGFDRADLDRAGLAEALGGDPVIHLAGGHGPSGAEVAPLDLARLEAEVAAVAPEVMAFAIAASFATRNPAHEIAARDIVRRVARCPVTCSHELSARLGGPKRALTAVLNARLVGMIDRLVAACERHLAAIRIDAPLMVVRGDGALISAAVARERPIETILSGPAASIVGARWLTQVPDALVADIGGTTTDVAVLRDGLPEIDPEGARVGGYRTMVEAVAMRTTGLGGDSEVHLPEGLEGVLRLGPRRLVPVALLAAEHPACVHAALDRSLLSDAPAELDGRFVLPTGLAPTGLAPREAQLLDRIAGPMPLATAIRTRLDLAALERLVARGLVMLSGVTPSDASHVLGRLDSWDGLAAGKALALMARRRNARGDRTASDARTLAEAILDRLTDQTIDCLLEVALAEDGFEDPAALVRHPLLRAGLARQQGTLALSCGLRLPVVGLGASARSYYPSVGTRLGCEMILPDHAGVANAIGAVVGLVSQRLTAQVTSPGEGRYCAHLPDGPRTFPDPGSALEAAESVLRAEVTRRAVEAGADEPRVTVVRDLREVSVEGQSMFLEGTVTATAAGRPRMARS